MERGIALMDLETVDQMVQVHGTSRVKKPIPRTTPTDLIAHARARAQTTRASAGTAAPRTPKPQPPKPAAYSRTTTPSSSYAPTPSLLPLPTRRLTHALTPRAPAPRAAGPQVLRERPQLPHVDLLALQAPALRHDPREDEGRRERRARHREGAPPARRRRPAPAALRRRRVRRPVLIARALRPSCSRAPVPSCPRVSVFLRPPLLRATSSSFYLPHLHHDLSLPFFFPFLFLSSLLVFDPLAARHLLSIVRTNPSVVLSTIDRGRLGARIASHRIAAPAKAFTLRYLTVLARIALPRFASSCPPQFLFHARRAPRCLPASSLCVCPLLTGLCPPPSLSIPRTNFFT